MNFWYKPKLTVPAIFLWPLSLLTRVVAFLKFKKRKTSKQNVPVIVIGNITVGGTGKTPTIIWLANLLKREGYKVGVVSRGYGAKPTETFPVQINLAHSALQVGDEPKLISIKTSAHVVIDPKRMRAVDLLTNLPREKRPDVIISDDGLQHYQMPRQLELLMVDPERGFGNGLLLPSGPLREPISRLDSVDYLLAKEPGKFAADLECHVGSSNKLLAVNKDNIELVPQKVTVLTAIGNPQSFINTLTQMGYEVVHSEFFRDHSEIPKASLDQTTMPIVVTEKDAIKIEKWPENLFVLPFELSYSTTFEQELLKRIKEICQ